jgi:hypothetical protein
MSLLQEIQNDAVDSQKELSSVLRKCKLIAARLGSKPLENWLLWESSGYPKDVELPAYRVWPVQLKGHFFGSFGSSLKYAPIPSVCVPEKIRDESTIFHCRQSVASIEQLLQENTSGSLQTGTGDLAVALGSKVYDDMNCVQAWGEFPSGCLVEVLNAVRNRVLDFALALWKESPTAGELEERDSSLQSEKVTQIFNTTVYGGAANLVGSVTGSTMSINVAAGDIQALEKVLHDHSIADSDISELKSALESDPKPLKPDAFGPAVSSWIAKMMKKAASGVWNIGVSAAGHILGETISRYYGLIP